MLWPGDKYVDFAGTEPCLRSSSGQSTFPAHMTGRARVHAECMDDPRARRHLRRAELLEAGLPVPLAAEVRGMGTLERPYRFLIAGAMVLTLPWRSRVHPAAWRSWAPTATLQSAITREVRKTTPSPSSPASGSRASWWAHDAPPCRGARAPFRLPGDRHDGPSLPRPHRRARRPHPRARSRLRAGL